MGREFHDTTDQGVILRTSNGGATWVIQFSAGEGHRYFRDVDFVDAANGWVVGPSGTAGSNAVVVHSTTGGSSWSPQSPGTLGLMATDFVDSTTGWAVGVRGLIVRTTDAGATWQIQRPPSDDAPWLLDVHFINGTTGWAVGGHGIILKTTNGGTGS